MYKRQVDEYANFASTIPGGAKFDVNERDSLTYVDAERVYMRGAVAEARNSFTRYLQTFPEGAFSLNANYYIGLIDYNQKADVYKRQDMRNTFGCWYGYYNSRHPISTWNVC